MNHSTHRAGLARAAFRIPYAILIFALAIWAWPKTLSATTPPPSVTMNSAPLTVNSATIVINGSGFDTTPENNTVVFNDGAVGVVSAAAPTSLTVTFSSPPATAGNLTAVVTSDGVDSGAAVQVATVIPTITMNPALLPANSATIVINGSGFDTTPANNTVVFNDGAVGVVTAAAPTSLTVTFSSKPASAGNLTAVVTSDGQGSGAAVQIATVIPTTTMNTAVLPANSATVVINGFGFDSTPANNTVVFNDGAVGVVSAAAPTSLTVTFQSNPALAGNLTAVVTSNGLGSGAAVQVATVIPTVTMNSALLPADSTTIVINGSGFDSTPAKNTVAFTDGATGVVSAAGPTSLTVTFKLKPASAGNLAAIVTSDGQASGVGVQVATVTPVITSSTRNLALNAGKIVINGVGFDPSTTGNTVVLGDGAVGDLIQATTTALTVNFSTKPTATGVLTAVVTSNSVSSGAPIQVANVVPAVDPMVVATTATLPANSATLVINGSDFDPVAVNDTVFLDNGVAGAVTAASATSLTVTFSTRPSIVGPLHAVVEVDGVFSPSQPVAIVTPVATATTASLPADVGRIVINGFGFNQITKNNTVVFNDGAVGKVVIAKPGALTVTFSTYPRTAGPLTATVTTNGVSSGSPVTVATVIPVVTANPNNLSATASSIVINGYGFDPTAAHNTVVFDNGATGVVTSATTISLTVAFTKPPVNPGPVHATVIVGGVSSAAPVQVATALTQNAPSVTSSSATLTATASSLVINGNGFDPTPGNNSVIFNDGAVGAVVAASSTSLTVNLTSKPTTAGNLVATVTSNGRSSGFGAVVASVAPVVTASAATLAADSETVVINGAGFDPVESKNVVTFNDGAKGKVLTASPTSMLVTFLTPPTVAGILTARVVTNGVSSGSNIQIATVAPVVVLSTNNLPASSNEVVINGSGFGFDASIGHVSFNDGAVGSVTSMSGNSLTVTFSTKPTAPGPLTAVVTINSVSSGSAVQIATALAPGAPMIASSVANLPINAPSFIINGSGFDVLATNNTVTLSNGAVGAVTSATSTALTVRLTTPPSLGVLTAIVSSKGLSSGAGVQVATVVPAITTSAANLPANVDGIVINGFGFDPTTGATKVSFNDGAVGKITAATETSLTVQFTTKPSVAGSLLATVTSDSFTSAATQVATIAPVIDVSTANLSTSASTLTITGSGFDPVASHNTVVFNDGAVGSVTASASNYLSVQFSVKPTNAGPLAAMVTSNSVSSGNGAFFQVATIVATNAPTVTTSEVNLPANSDGITINGSGFDTLASNNSVVFSDGAVGSVTTATATSLTVAFATHPAIAGVLTAIVTTNGVSSGQAVTVATVAPAVTANTIDLPANVNMVVITGFGFDPAAANNRLTLNDGAAGTVVSATPTALTVRFTIKPGTAGPLLASVLTKGIPSAADVQIATVTPVVNESSINILSSAKTLVIRGNGFAQAAEQNSVKFDDNGAVGTVTDASTTSLTVTFSTAPVPGVKLYATVTSNSVKSGSSVHVATVLAAPVVTVDPQSATVALGKNASFTAAASGDPLPKVQWQVSTDDGAIFTNIVGAKARTLGFKVTAGDNGALYRAVFTNDQGSVTTIAANLTVSIPVVAENVAAYTTDSTPVTIDVLSAAENPGNDTLTITSVTQGRHGSVSIIDGGGEIQYTPNGAVQDDSFRYTISDGIGDFSSATVTIRSLVRSASGVYNGLVQAADGTAPTNDSAGLIRITINPVNGKFTGSLVLAKSRYVLAGQFSSSGVATFGLNATPTFALKRKNLPGLELALHLVLDNPIVELTGTVTTNGDAFATVTAERAQTKVASALSGAYTVIFAPKPASNSSLAADDYPQGYGVGRVKVLTNGNVHIVGTLADGANFTYANALSKANNWPVYIPFNHGNSSLSGFAAFGKNAMLHTDITGQGLSWFKTERRTAVNYPSGWPGGIQTDLLGSKFVVPPPTAPGSILPGLAAPSVSGNASIDFADADLADQGISQNLNISAKNVVTVIRPNENHLTFTKLDKNGIFTGAFVDPTSRVSKGFKGIIFQDHSAGYGFFLSGGQSGSVILQPK